MTRLIALHLPQYHPIPENDQWWGKGFTEWHNVARARALFPGHAQPHLPADLGFYDLRLPEARQAQADLAREYGIGGFCYYHYWFNGRRLLNRPFDEIAASGSPDLPYCLCWANEDWSRAWDGRSRDLLIAQRYGREDDLAHIRFLIPLMEDPRWIRVDGKPLFLVYRAGLLPDARATTDLWREEARRAGTGELHLVKVESLPEESLVAPSAQGFDSSLEFQPKWSDLGPKRRDNRIWRRIRSTGTFRDWIWFRHNVHEYDQFVERQLQAPPARWDRIPSVVPMWDNTARRERGGIVLHGSTPEAYEHFLRETIRVRAPRDTSTDLVFVNAWNEWAEGNHLEPCQRWGRAYLEATRRALGGSGG